MPLSQNQIEEHHMDYESVKKKISSGLTGDPTHDIPYLYQQLDKYKDHEDFTDIKGELGRLRYDLYPFPAKAKTVASLGMHASLGKNIKVVADQILQKKSTRACKILALETKRFETCGMFEDNEEGEYHYFNNVFEATLFGELKHPKKEIFSLPYDFAQLYFFYGNRLMNLKLFAEAEEALFKALAINPVRSDILFELSELSRMQGKMEEYLDRVYACYPIAYTSKSLARWYRNLGYYYVTSKEYDVATALYILSAYYDPTSPEVQRAFEYMTKQAGRKMKMQSFEKARRLIESKKIPLVANLKLVELAHRVGKLYEADNKPDRAEFCFSIITDLTRNKEFKAVLDERSTPSS
jgi:tetratricopeptide (TPR) repeat protein